MGMDMCWRVKDDADLAAFRQASAEWHAALAVRDAFPRGSWAIDFNTDEITGTNPAAVAAAQHAHELFEAMRRVERYCFRLNAWAMTRWVNAMRSLGMVCQPQERRDWPEIESYGIAWADVEAVDYPEDAQPRSPELHERAQRYVADRDALLARHGGECPGIPEHKFGSNDGWLVTPAECEAALRILADKPADVVLKALEDAGCDVDYWQRWVEFIQGAISHDGFEVN